MAFLKDLFDRILEVFGGRTQPAEPTPAVPAGLAPEPIVISTVRVLALVYDPIMDAATGKTLSAVMRWTQPEILMNTFSLDILETSGGLARYQIVQRVDVSEFLPLEDGFLYTPTSFAQVLTRTATPHSPSMLDYNALLSRFRILEKVAAHEIDEVWVFAFPYAGLYESIMGGPGAFWCNSKPLPNTQSSLRRFVIMSFSAERGVGEMLEAFGHRVESILEKTYEKLGGSFNLYEKFSRYDKKTPGRAEVGNIHFAPNSEQDYDWGNQRFVPSRCDDWYNFPNFKGVLKQVNAAEWGNGDIRAHHKWWLNHIPKVAGKNNSIANNWWQYIMDPNRVKI